jgi:hypothetical protein
MVPDLPGSQRRKRVLHHPALDEASQRSAGRGAAAPLGKELIDGRTGPAAGGETPEQAGGALIVRPP